MSRGKQQTGGSGKKKKETRAERRVRLEAEAEAREQCFKILPYVAGAIFVLVVAFALWVRSVPPKVVEQPEFEINEQSFVPPEGLESDIKVEASTGSGTGPDVVATPKVTTEEIIDEGTGDTGEEDVTEL